MQSLCIIAECAQGYASPTIDESISLALMLTRCAKSAGADAIKFQLVIASELATPDYVHFQLFKSLELGLDGWKKVSALANELNIDLMFDIFGSASLAIAEMLGSAAVKIHPTDFTNSQLISEVSSSSIPTVIAGCGGASPSEIKSTAEKLNSIKSLVFMHGFQGYPTPRRDNCLSRLRFLKDFIDQQPGQMILGFADHAEPTSADATHLAATSIGFGVQVIEKHLTIARCLQLEDYESALSPDEFLAFSRTLRACSEARFDDLISSISFELPDSEQAYRRAVSRHVVAKTNLESGHIVDAADLSLKRTSSTDYIVDPLLVIGKQISQPMTADTPFTHTLISE